MCQDHHVADLLDCLESWLMRSFGVPSEAQPWRIGKLDLSRNGLSDTSVVHICERLKLLRIRVRRLDLDGNRIGAEALVALTGYVWNCPEPLHELGLANNDITIGTAGDGDDPVSALLRCLYNHAGYPRKSAPADAVTQITPLVLRLGTNSIADGDRLLARIREKAGQSRVKFCDSADPYASEGEEFLAVCLPDFRSQRGCLTVDSEVREGELKKLGDSLSGLPPPSLSRSPERASPADEDGSSVSPDSAGAGPAAPPSVAGSEDLVSEDGSGDEGQATLASSTVFKAHGMSSLAEEKPGSMLIAELRKGQRADGRVVKVMRSQLSATFGAEVNGVMKARDAIKHVEDMRQIFKIGDFIYAEVRTINVSRRRVFLRQIETPTLEWGHAQATAAKPKMLATAAKPKMMPCNRSNFPKGPSESVAAAEPTPTPASRAAPAEPREAAVPEYLLPTFLEALEVPVPIAPAERPKPPKLLTPVAMPPQEGAKEDDEPPRQGKRRVRRRRAEKELKPAQASTVTAKSPKQQLVADPAPIEAAHKLDTERLRVPKGEEEQHLLGGEVRAKLQRTAALSDHDAETLGELADLVVMMLSAGKAAHEVHSELEGFLCEGTGDFVKWLTAHLKSRTRSSSR